MANTINISADFRKDLAERGGESASRCFQCATCTSVCQLATSDAMFPRRQMYMAQWGMAEKLIADPGVWLCHQCNDCTARCPRDAKPGDIMQVIRSKAVETLAIPPVMGKLVANAAKTWPILIGAPLLFWILAMSAVNGLNAPEHFREFGEVVPHWLIYLVFFPTVGFVTAAMYLSGKKFWDLLGEHGRRKGSFFANIVPVLIEILTHKRFDSCEASKSRRLGHMALLFGFAGAAITSGFLVIDLYIPAARFFYEEMPLPLWHPYKLLGNVSAVLLVYGAFVIVRNRLTDMAATGASTAFDTFFLGVVVVLVATGVLTEAARLALPPAAAMWLYIFHLTAVLTLFATFPYSKFAHIYYRTLAMIHERMIK